MTWLTALHPTLRRLWRTMHSDDASPADRVAAQNAFVWIHQRAAQVVRLLALVGLILIVWWQVIRG